MGDTVVQEVKEGEIPLIGAAEASEQEGEQEQGEQQVQQGQQGQQGPVVPVPGSDPLSTLPLATLESAPELVPELGEGKTQEEGVEPLPEEEEEEEEEDYETKLNLFYTTRSRYFRGVHEGQNKMIQKLLKVNKKVAKKQKDITEETAGPLHGPYFILVKDPIKSKKKKNIEGEEGEEGEEEEEEEEEEEDKKNTTTILFFPENTRYTTTGDLQQVKKTRVESDTEKGKYKTKEEVSDIEIPTYRPLTAKELEDNLASPNTAINKAQEEYNKAHAAMRLALKEKNHLNLKERMNALYKADLKLLRTRFAARAIYIEDNVTINTILFDRPKDTSIIDYPIGRFIGSKIPLTKRYVTDKAPPAEQQLGGDRESAHVIVINMPDGDNGILSPFFQIPFTIEGIVYSCVYKAILCLLVSELGQTKEHYIGEMSPFDNPQDLKEYDPLIREGQDEKKIEGHLATLIAEIYRVALQQNPLMTNTLKATGDALLVVVPLERPMDSFLGVGVDPNQTDLITNPTKWKGRNMYGNVLMDLRKELSDVQVPQDLPVVIEQIEGQVQVPEGQVPEGSIPLDEEIGEEEEEVPEIVLQEEEKNLV